MTQTVSNEVALETDGTDEPQLSKEQMELVQKIQSAINEHQQLQAQFVCLRAQLQGLADQMAKHEQFVNEAQAKLQGGQSA